MTTKESVIVAHLVNPRLKGVVQAISEHFGWISEVTELDGSGRQTNGDVYIHQDDCDPKLAVGLKIEFDLTEDPKRHGRYRAMKATNCLTDLVLVGESRHLPALVTRQDYHRRAKTVPEVEVRKAMQNRPLEAVVNHELDRVVKLNTTDDVYTFISAYLYDKYPGLEVMEVSFDLRQIDPDEQQKVDAYLGLQKELGLEAQAVMQQTEYVLFRATRETLKFMAERDFITPGMKITPKMLGALVGEFDTRALRVGNADITASLAFMNQLTRTFGFLRQNDLLRPGTILPIKNVVDLAVAAPVWFVEAHEQLPGTWNSHDPEPDAAVQYFCGLVPTQEWADFYQMFNRRTRCLSQYRGDSMPRHILKTIALARQHFDFVVIATPYHDIAGKEWGDPAWQRLIDPYLFGFKKGLPYMFFLGRWSDTGLFPLIADLVADTMKFLRENHGRLSGFGAYPYWHFNDKNSPVYTDNSYRNAGVGLQRFAQQLLTAFDQGILFDFLRGEAEPCTTQSQTDSRVTD